MHATGSGIRDLLKIKQRLRSSGIGDGKRRMSAQEVDEREVDPSAEAFDVGRMDEKFVTVGG